MLKRSDLIAPMPIAFLLCLCGIASIANAAADIDHEPPTYLAALFPNAMIAQDEIQIDRQMAYGAVAFNSPYLYGGVALHDAITCVACHGPKGPSGPALKLTFDQPVPDLYSAQSSHRALQRTHLDAFIRKAIVNEFAGPPPNDAMVTAISDYVEQLNTVQMTAHQFNADAAGLAALCLALLSDEMQGGKTDDADFLIETARYAIGQSARARSEMSEDGTLQNQVQQNTELKEISRLLERHPLGVERDEIERRIEALQRNLLKGRLFVLRGQ